MRSMLALSMTLATGLALMAASPTYAAPETFVYEGAGCSGAAVLPYFEAVLGRKVDGVTDFDDYTSTWANAHSAMNWGLGCWQGVHVKNIDISLPMKVAAGGSLTDDHSADFAEYGKQLVSHGFDHAYVRIGWEFNGGWYPWTAAPGVAPFDKNRPAKWITAYQRDAKALKSTCPNCKVIWNPSMFEQGIWPDSAYPGDESVDVIATDAYNVEMIYTKDPKARWTQVDTYSWGVNDVLKFAKKHNKPVAFPEWGTGTASNGLGGMDDPYFVQQMAKIAADPANDVVMHSYWDYKAGDYDSNLSLGSRPQTEQAFIAAFSTPNVAEIVGAHSAPFASPQPYSPTLAVTCGKAQCTSVQNGPTHYEVFVSSPVDQTVSLELPWVAKGANVYDPAVGTSPVKALGSTAGTILNLRAGQELIIGVSK